MLKDKDKVIGHTLTGEPIFQNPRNQTSKNHKIWEAFRDKTFGGKPSLMCNTSYRNDRTLTWKTHGKEIIIIWDQNKDTYTIEFNKPGISLTGEQIAEIHKVFGKNTKESLC